jgi:hypothetical protein
MKIITTDNKITKIKRAKNSTYGIAGKRIRFWSENLKGQLE